MPVVLQLTGAHKRYGEQSLLERQLQLGGELVRIGVATLDTIGGHRALRPRMPVTQWAVTKP